MYSAPISAPRLASWPSAVSPGGERGVIRPKTMGSCAQAWLSPTRTDTSRAPPANPPRRMALLLASNLHARLKPRADADQYCRGERYRVEAVASGRPRQEPLA